MHVDFYYDFVSPYSFFASLRLGGFRPPLGAKVNWVPVRLVRLLELSDNVSPVTVPKKARYMLRDLKRWGLRFGVPFSMQHPPFFDTEAALVSALALTGEERERYSAAVFLALWTGQVAPADGADWVDRALKLARLPSSWARPERCSSACSAGRSCRRRSALG